MKKVLISMLSVSLLVFVLTGISYGWQGKMAGMGDPYGLVQDESDFLIHPARIAAGEGVRFYGDVRFTYTDVTDWDYNLDSFNTAGTLTGYYHYDTSGDEQSYETMVGSSFPLGPGRMGVFFSYDGIRGDYDGDEDRSSTNNYLAHDLSNDLDNLALRLLYGLPLDGVTLGGEVQLAYRQGEDKTWWKLTDLSRGSSNYPWGGYSKHLNLFPFMIPYDSDYWEALLKGSLEGEIGPADVEFTLRGGYLFGGDNRYTYDFQNPYGTSWTGFELAGDVDGWRMGGDLWVRYPLSGGLSLPFLVRADYREKTRDGDGLGVLAAAGRPFRYEHQERKLELEAGGGVDKNCGKGTRIATGLYYQYLQGSNDIWIWEDLGASTATDDYSDYPASTEHRVLVRFAAERELSAAASLRMGLNLFYGWAGEDFMYTYKTTTGTNYTDDISLDGNRWGIGASMGGTFRFKSFTLEPFLSAGWQDLQLDGDGTQTGTSTALYKMDKSRSEWYIGGGFSILFDR